MKISLFLQKKPEVSNKAFREWWSEQGMHLSQRLKLEEYRLNSVFDVVAFGGEGYNLQFDATGEFWLDADDNPAGEAYSLIAEENIPDIEEYCSRWVEYHTKEHVLIDRPGQDTSDKLKLVVLMKRKPDMSTEEWRHWWLRHVEGSKHIEGMRGYCIDFIEHWVSFGCAERDLQFDGTAQLWFDSVEAMNSGFSSPVGAPLGQDAADHNALRARYLTTEILIQEPVQR